MLNNIFKNKPIHKKLDKLDKEYNSDYLFVNKKDWSDYELELPNKIRGIYTMAGYLQSYNPVKKRLDKCLTFRGKPVFIKNNI